MFFPCWSESWTTGVINSKNTDSKYVYKTVKTGQHLARLSKNISEPMGICDCF